MTIRPHRTSGPEILTVASASDWLMIPPSGASSDGALCDRDDGGGSVTRWMLNHFSSDPSNSQRRMASLW